VTRVAIVLAVLTSISCGTQSGHDAGIVAGDGGRIRNGLIAFSATVAGTTQEQIFSADHDGGSRRQLTVAGINRFPSWTWDGTRLYFCSNRTGRFEIFSMAADGTGQQIFTVGTLPGNKLLPRPSPDGSKIAFVYEDPAVGHPEIWIVSATGQDAKRLTTTAKALAGPTWSLLPSFSPDGKQIAYGSTASGSTQIWVMNADGSNQKQLTSGLGSDFPDANAPAWSRDGRMIAFWAGFETQYGEIWVMNADGSNPQQLTDQPGTISSDNPAWSPDGTKLLFDTNRANAAEIWIMNADGSDQRRLMTVDAENTQFSWQPVP